MTEDLQGGYKKSDFSREENDFTLVCDYKKLEAFWQFEQIVQWVSCLASTAQISADIDDYQSSQSLMCNSLDSSPMGVVAVNSSGQVIYFNQRLIDLWQLPPGIVATYEHSQYMAYFQSCSTVPESFRKRTVQISEKSDTAGMTTLALKDGRVFEQFSQPLVLKDVFLNSTLENSPPKSSEEAPKAKKPTAKKSTKSSLKDSSLQKSSSQESSSQESSLETDNPDVEAIAPLSIGRVWGYLQTFPAESNNLQAAAEASPKVWPTLFLSGLKISPAMTFVLSNGELFYANPAVEKATGYTLQEILQHPQFSLLSQHSQNRSIQEQKISLSSNPPEQELLKKNGKALWLQYSSQNFYMGDRKFTILSATDITVLKRQKNHYRHSLIVNKNLAQKRLQLTSQVMHRAISALNLISMSVDLLETYQTRWNEAQKKKYLHKIRLAFHQLHSFIERLEKITQISLGTDKIDLKSPLTDVYKICCDLVEEFKRTYQNHAFVSLSTADQTLTYLDKEIIQAILVNLLENASKYSSASLIKVILINDIDRIILQVHDCGIGIPPSDCVKVFEPFYRASNAGGIEGVGMGLTIAKALTDVLEGQISVSSEIGNGTIATVMLPQKHSYEQVTTLL
jgi:PAS domain S-box-containing protein